MGKYIIASVVLTIFVALQYEVDARPPLGIVNGTDAEDGEFPYIVQLLDHDYRFKCGGSIIGDEWILTARHCLKDHNILAIVYGTNEVNRGSKLINNIAVKNWFPHPKYSEYYLGIPIYDVGILQLEEKIPFSDKAQPIKLPEAGQKVPFHVQGVLAGWGNNETYGVLLKQLQKINLQLLTDEECTNKIIDKYGQKLFKPIHNICSDDYWNGECFGDSGSPYVINETQYGIVSWSLNPCGIVPGAYSRLTNPEYRDWIKEVTNI